MQILSNRLYRQVYYSLGSFHPLEVVDRASETQLQMGEKLFFCYRYKKYYLMNECIVVAVCHLIDISTNMHHLYPCLITCRSPVFAPLVQTPNVVCVTIIMPRYRVCCARSGITWLRKLAGPNYGKAMQFKCPLATLRGKAYACAQYEVKPSIAK